MPNNNNQSPIVLASHSDEIALEKEKDFPEECDESDEEKEHHHHPLRHPDLIRKRKKKRLTHAHDHHYGENHWRHAALGLLWGAALLVLSVLSLNIPMTAYYIITGLTTLMTLYLGRSVYRSAYQALRHKTVDSTTLYTISTFTIVAVSIMSLFVPGLPMMAEAAPFVLGFWHLGEAVEHTLVEKIKKKSDVRACIPPLVRLKATDKMVSVKKLVPNDIIIIKKGDFIPVDGIVMSTAWLYTNKIDGAPDSKKYESGAAVKVGMQLEDLDFLHVRVTKTYQDSSLSIMAKELKKASEEKEEAPLETLANTVLKYFIPGLITVALISGIVIGTLFTPALAIQCVVAVFVSACPCALRLITPLAVKMGMQKAHEKGVHFTSGKALQAAADVDTIVFDLNGTLTKGKSKVRSFKIADEKLLPYVALLQSQSDRPTAKIIQHYIQHRGIALANSSEISAIDKSDHNGIKGIMDGKLFIIGNENMLKANGIEEVNKPYNNPENGSTYIFLGNKVIGQIATMDPLRDDAVATVNQLKRLGKTVHICTGSDKRTAEKYAEMLNIDKKNICFNTVGAVSKPGEIPKTSYVKKLQNEGHKVAMVGDGTNDLTAMESSHLGIAVKSSIGDALTEEYAGIVMQQGSLFPIATALDVGKKTKRNIIQNLMVSLTYNSIITLVAAGLFVILGFALNPAIGVALMVLETSIILGNLYRFKQQEVLSAPPSSKAIMADLGARSATATMLKGMDYDLERKAELREAPSPRIVNCSSPQRATPVEVINIANLSVGVSRR